MSTQKGIVQLISLLVVAIIFAGSIYYFAERNQKQEGAAVQQVQSVTGKVGDTTTITNSVKKDELTTSIKSQTDIAGTVTIIRAEPVSGALAWGDGEYSKSFSRGSKVAFSLAMSPSYAKTVDVILIVPKVCEGPYGGEPSCWGEGVPFVIAKDIPLPGSFVWNVGTDVNGKAIHAGAFRICLGTASQCAMGDGSLGMTYGNIEIKDIPLNSLAEFKQCTAGSAWGCGHVTQGEAPNPDSPPPTVCGCAPKECPAGQYLITSGANGTWSDGSQKGTFSCSSEYPP